MKLKRRETPATAPIPKPSPKAAIPLAVRLREAARHVSHAAWQPDIHPDIRTWLLAAAETLHVAHAALTWQHATSQASDRVAAAKALAVMVGHTLGYSPPDLQALDGGWRVARLSVTASIVACAPSGDGAGLASRYLDRAAEELVRLDTTRGAAR